MVLWETTPTTITRKKGMSYVNFMNCRIRLREILNRKGSDQKIMVKLVLLKIIIVRESTYLLKMATPNLMKVGFLIHVVCFICIIIRTGFQHMKLCLHVM